MPTQARLSTSWLVRSPCGCFGSIVHADVAQAILLGMIRLDGGGETQLTLSESAIRLRPLTTSTARRSKSSWRPSFSTSLLGLL